MKNWIREWIKKYFNLHDYWEPGGGVFFPFNHAVSFSSREDVRRFVNERLDKCPEFSSAIHLMCGDTLTIQEKIYEA